MTCSPDTDRPTKNGLFVDSANRLRISRGAQNNEPTCSWRADPAGPSVQKSNQERHKDMVATTSAENNDIRQREDPDQRRADSLAITEQRTYMGAI